MKMKTAVDEMGLNLQEKLFILELTFPNWKNSAFPSMVLVMARMVFVCKLHVIFGMFVF